MKSKKLAWDSHGRYRLTNWCHSPAANKVNDLQFVPVFERGCLPQRAGNDFKIQLHRDTVRLHAKLCDEGVHSQTFREVALFAIDVEEHEEVPSN